ncbi:hypothetical protein CYMTET_49957 [Cymbomonas tetramitiformis]|uniref:Uncharacterized protein n=1 Tax=Cymbomonas tetramitiformis TaxID=36881 RepID=A0AAE0ETM2_9CHLO|nr:hypothetical protein CYMTET_49957 [Cymbomonas tetramitiformis]
MRVPCVIQSPDELKLKNTDCDNCLMATAIFLQQLACICKIAALISRNEAINNLSNIIDNIADLLWCSVMSCMQTQHHMELEKREKGPPLVSPETQTLPSYQGGAQAVGYTANGEPVYAQAVPVHSQAPMTRE